MLENNHRTGSRAGVERMGNGFTTQVVVKQPPTTQVQPELIACPEGGSAGVGSKSGVHDDGFELCAGNAVAAAHETLAVMRPRLVGPLLITHEELENIAEQLQQLAQAAEVGAPSLDEDILAGLDALAPGRVEVPALLLKHPWMATNVSGERPQGG